MANSSSDEDDDDDSDDDDKKDSESDDYYEGVKKFDCSFADFDAYMNDLDMEIESRFGPIGLGLWLGNGVKKIKRATLARSQRRWCACLVGW